MPLTRVAILGYGRSGSTLHANAIAANSEFTLAAVCDIDPARRQQAAQRFNCPVYEDYHEMLQREQLDLVSVVTRSDQHCRMTCDCLRAGVNVLVTKPWAVNADEARQMIAAARESGKLLLPWLPARWGSVLRRLQELLAARTIGDVFLVRRIVSSFATRNDWQTERKYGGGYLLNWGAHIVDPPVVLMQSRVKSVYGQMRQVINPGDGEDVFMALLTLENGCLVQVEHTVSADPLPGWVVQGTRGTITARGRKLVITKGTPPAPSDPTHYAGMAQRPPEVIHEEVVGEEYGDGAEIYAEVHQALTGVKPFAVTTDDALALSVVLDAIRESSLRNTVVQL